MIMKEWKFKMLKQLFNEYNSPDINNKSQVLESLERLKIEYQVESLQSLINILTTTINDFDHRTNYQTVEHNQSISEHKKNKEFIGKGSKRIVPEKAIQYHLVHRKNNLLGNFIAYQVPFVQATNYGEVDLISYNGELNLIELKACAIRGSKSSTKESKETLLRAVLEIATYYNYFYNLDEKEFAVFREELSQNSKNIIGKDISFNKDDMVMCVIVPKSIYDSCNPDLLKEILNLNNFKFYCIEQIEKINDDTNIGIPKDIFEITEFKENHSGNILENIVVIKEKDELLENMNYVSLDCETNGVNDLAQFIRISAVRVRNGKIVDTFNELIKPDDKLSSKIEDLTKITNEMVKDAFNEKDVLKRFISWLNDDMVVTHNVLFDMKYFNLAKEKYNLPKLENTFIDTYELSKKLDKGFKHTMADIIERYNITCDENDGYEIMIKYIYEKYIDILNSMLIYNVNEINLKLQD